MAKTWTKKEHTPATSGRGKKTSIGRRNVGFSNMNKNRKRSFKAYRGQGKWLIILVAGTIQNNYPVDLEKIKNE